MPAVTSTLVAKVIDPEVLVFLKKETAVPESSVTTTSGLPSASRSPRTKPIGLEPAAAETSTLAAKVMVPELVFLNIEKEELL